MAYILGKEKTSMEKGKVAKPQSGRNSSPPHNPAHWPEEEKWSEERVEA